MNTKLADGRFRVAGAAVTGARHLRAARNGQDAVAVWAGDEAAAIVVCDGCSAGASSEVGARFGASLIVRTLADRLAAGARPGDDALWTELRARVARAIESVAAQLPDGGLADCFMFTIVAAAATRDDAAVWMLGDGAYALDGDTHELGPFADNQPPYLAYDLLGEPRFAHFAPAPHGCRTIAIATDGARDLACSLAYFATPRFFTHPDALRRELAVHARAGDRIDWDARRVSRVPAQLQDDCAIAVLHREAA
ncbi:MAG: protein phosphatase 2C domain-containing protein [Acidobacteriota bacterium]